MIAPKALHDKIVEQDAKLREGFAWWSEPQRLQIHAALSHAEILAEGLAAIHERLGMIADILADKS